ncbi:MULTISPECIES: 5,6-dimethylbenzimidazole synthase [unclassified Lysobacter]|uniref:5,6-dimethylbenzimidazole synthase n=1 Tax=unclassified Lysobacter TaxID=2635362 RepID=UPI0006FA6217|nr:MULTISPECIES: 5,6-dimethylbenzimidazole synthase [unclassified Lysobacter]KRA14643.1 5,6-dimethylbenzimidazole synthase [Lysobacter sp. Root604]KRD34382.1 5,6-dimethylbenzimidazole synthase [Lysobacter sp. Root916]
MSAGHRFSDAERGGVYRAIFERRDVRSQFLPDPIPADVLERLLRAAHHAPSVGFMQPWDFIVVEDPAVKHEVKALHAQANAQAAHNYRDERAELYRQLKLEGIVESPINLCITCDRGRGGEHVLGRNTMLDADLFSACLAVQNLWLAARAEGIGVGWVSILEPRELARVLGLPEGVEPLAYLCLGYVSQFLERPELETRGWRSRLPLQDLVHANAWGGEVQDPALRSALLAGEPDRDPARGG